MEFPADWTVLPKDNFRFNPRYCPNFDARVRQNTVFDLEATTHRLDMELYLQSLFGLLCTAVLIGWDPATTPPPSSPRIWAHIRGRYRQWSAKIDDISL
jgi:hypothetical protein